MHAYSHVRFTHIYAHIFVHQISNPSLKNATAMLWPVAHLWSRPWPRLREASIGIDIKMRRLFHSSDWTYQQIRFLRCWDGSVEMNSKAETRFLVQSLLTFSWKQRPASMKNSRVSFCCQQKFALCVNSASSCDIRGPLSFWAPSWAYCPQLSRCIDPGSDTPHDVSKSLGITVSINYWLNISQAYRNRFARVALKWQAVFRGREFRIRKQ